MFSRKVHVGAINAAQNIPQNNMRERHRSIGFRQSSNAINGRTVSMSKNSQQSGSSITGRRTVSTLPRDSQQANKESNCRRTFSMVQRDAGQGSNEINDIRTILTCDPQPSKSQTHAKRTVAMVSRAPQHCRNAISQRRTVAMESRDAVNDDSAETAAHDSSEDDDDPKDLFVFEFEDKDGKKYKQYVKEGVRADILAQRMGDNCRLSPAMTRALEKFLQAEIDKRTHLP